MTSWVSKVVVAVVLVSGCGTTYGPALSNTGSTKHDVYLYGAHAAGPRVTGDSATEDESDEAVPVDLNVDSRSAQAHVGSKDKPPKKSVAVEPDGGVPEEPAAKVAFGTYKGTDWVTIDLPGFPGSEQVDDKARVVLAAVSDESRLSFTVLDTNSGNELCSVEGVVADDTIAFEAGQPCFEGILGVSMQTSLYEGEGSMTDEGLTVTLGIELTLMSPDGDEIVGDLSYRFEGKLKASATPGD